MMYGRHSATSGMPGGAGHDLFGGPGGAVGDAGSAGSGGGMLGGGVGGAGGMSGGVDARTSNLERQRALAAERSRAGGRVGAGPSLTDVSAAGGGGGGALGRSLSGSLPASASGVTTISRGAPMFAPAVGGGAAAFGAPATISAGGGSAGSSVHTSPSMMGATGSSSSSGSLLLMAGGSGSGFYGAGGSGIGGGGGVYGSSGGLMAHGASGGGGPLTSGMAGMSLADALRAREKRAAVGEPALAGGAAPTSADASAAAAGRGGLPLYAGPSSASSSTGGAPSGGAAAMPVPTATTGGGRVGGGPLPTPLTAAAAAATGPSSGPSTPHRIPSPSGAAAALAAGGFGGSGTAASASAHAHAHAYARGDPVSPLAPLAAGGKEFSTSSSSAAAAAAASSSSSSAAAAASGGGVLVCPASSLPLHDLRSFLTSPAPPGGGFVQCYIERDRTSTLSARMYPVYSLYLAEGDRFLLAGRKRGGNKTSNYMLCMDKRDLNRESAAFLGKLRGNFVGTSFTIYDDGLAPDKLPAEAAAAAAAAAAAVTASSSGSGAAAAAAASGTSDGPITVSTPTGPVAVRRELAVVEYASNVLGSRGPRKMRVALPVVSPETGRPVIFTPVGKDVAMMGDLFRAGHTRNMVQLVNKQPKWNDTVGAYVLNFNGRVTMASVKNFQLVTPEDEEAVLLQFGRTGKDEFTMDFAWPLSPLQAFAICLSSFDYKLACE